jgi:hypothetical protein
MERHFVLAFMGVAAGTGAQAARLNPFESPVAAIDSLAAIWDRALATAMSSPMSESSVLPGYAMCHAP